MNVYTQTVTLPPALKKRLAAFTHVSEETALTQELQPGEFVQFPVNSWTFEWAQVVSVTATAEGCTLKARHLTTRKNLARCFSAEYRHAVLICR